MRKTTTFILFLVTWAALVACKKDAVKLAPVTPIAIPSVEDDRESRVISKNRLRTITSTDCTPVWVNDYSDQYQFEKGIVVLGLDSTLTIDELFEFTDFLNVNVKYTSGFTYTSALPGDSTTLTRVLTLLNQKPYLLRLNGFKPGGYIHYQTQKITISPTFSFESRKEVEDWLEVASHLKLTQSIAASYAIIEVPEDQERSWMYHLARFCNVTRWAELNYYMNIEPH